MELIMYFDKNDVESLFSQKCAQKGNVYRSKLIIAGVPPSER